MGEQELGKVKRNKRIFDLWNSGKYKSFAALGRTYHLSRERVRRIIIAQEKKNGAKEES